MLDADPVISEEELRRRFAWARRQGRPAWLWPDVPLSAWRTAMGRIHTATAALLAGEAAPALEGDAEVIGLAGYTSGMGPMLGLWIEQERLIADDPVAAVLARHLAHNRVRAARMGEAGESIAGRLADLGVATVVLKGAHTGMAYFPEPGTRPASDIDFLVHAAAVASAEAALSDAGLVLKRRGRWESTWVHASAPGGPRSLTYVHAEDPWSVDLHSSLNVWAGGGAPIAELDLAGPMASRTPWQGDPRARALEQPLLLLYLAAHAGVGWHNLTLLRQLELVLVIRQDAAAGRLSWDEMLDVGAQAGALGYAYPALHLAEKLAPGLVPAPVLDACASHATPSVRRLLERLTPATGQRIDRNSLAEHFMWVRGWRGRVRQLADDLWPKVRSWSTRLGIYEERAWRIIRGRVSR